MIQYSGIESRRYLENKWQFMQRLLLVNDMRCGSYKYLYFLHVKFIPETDLFNKSSCRAHHLSVSL